MNKGVSHKEPGREVSNNKPHIIFVIWGINILNLKQGFN